MGPKTQYTRNYKPTLYCGLVTTVTLVSLTVFHFSKLVIVFEKPKIDPLYQFKRQNNNNNGPSDTLLTRNLSPSTCSPKSNIFFLKTHKTASTTVQNIILRYADKHNLYVALPAENSHLFPLKRSFKKQYVLPAPPFVPFGYNILCHHLVYNRKEVEKVLPKDAVSISIVRNPVDLFESLYEYENFKENYSLTLAEFAELTTDKTEIEKLNHKSKVPQNPLLKNFGLSTSNILNGTTFEKALNEIDKKFDLIMIMEHFDESIILLKELLCWKVEDMISFTNNARAPEYHTNLTQRTIDLLKRWNYGDQVLYDQFKKKFSDLLSYQLGKGIDIQGEVQQLRKLRSEQYDICIEQKVPSGKIRSQKFWSNKVVGYKLKDKSPLCQNLIKPEVVFTSEIRKKQNQWLMGLKSRILNKLGQW